MERTAQRHWRVRSHTDALDGAGSADAGECLLVLVWLLFEHTHLNGSSDITSVSAGGVATALESVHDCQPQVRTADHVYVQQRGPGVDSRLPPAHDTSLLEHTGCIHGACRPVSPHTLSVVRGRHSVLRTGVLRHASVPRSPHSFAWRPHQVFRTLSCRSELLNGMLAANHIGFHLFEYAWYDTRAVWLR